MKSNLFIDTISDKKESFKKESFKVNLLTVKKNLTESQFNYLNTCDDVADIYDALEVIIDNQYIVELDWLYSTLNNTWK